MGKSKAKQSQLQDLYEAEVGDAEEEKEAGRRYDVVDNFQYELPEDFEDEEIEEEEAFTEEDKKLFAHMFKGEAGEEDDEQAGQGAQLTRDDFSDDDSEADRRYGKPKKPRKQPTEQRDDSDVDDIFAGLSDADEADEDEEVEDAAEAEDLEQVFRAVSDVLGTSQKRKPKKQELLDEAVPESEFNVSLGGESQLSLTDLVRALGPEKGKKSKAQKQLAQLARNAEAVPAPLPTPIKARKERQAGYEATKKDVKKWIPIVRANREAPTLVFTAANNEVPRTTTTAALMDKFKPEGGMEAEVAALLKEAGITSDKAVEEAEEALALKAVSAEEVAQRRSELAKMRSLMFKHEEKARHLAKIKSKDYHRRSNRAARRKAEKAGEMDDKDFIRLEAERAEFERAKERLTLKHRNTSQWARRALKRGVNLHNDDGEGSCETASNTKTSNTLLLHRAAAAGTREAIAEQLRLGEELRRRVNRMDPVGGSDTDATDASDSDASATDSNTSEAGGKKMGRKAAAKANAAATAILEGASDEDEAVSKSLFTLPFMKRAQERRKLAAQKQAQRLLEELEGRAAEPDEGGMSGRRNFGLATGVQAISTAPDFGVDGDSGSDVNEDAEAKLERLQEAAASERRHVEHAQTNSSGADKAGRAQPSHTPKKRKRKAQMDVATAVSGILAAENWGLPEERVENEGAHDENGEAGRSLLGRVAAQQGSARGRAQLLSATDALTQRRTKNVAEHVISVGPARPATQAGQVDSEGASSEEDAEKDERGEDTVKEETQKCTVAITEPATVDGSEPAGFQVDMLTAGGKTSQRDLIAQAFAGDDVAAEFEAGKEAEIAADLPKVETPSQLPGWGTWASQQREPAWMIAARAKAEQQKEATKAGRKDAKLKDVVISERWDKKAAKFTTPALPFPFNSTEAFEGSMRHPLGSEFNTDASFRALTKPSVIKSSGVIIQPLKFSKAVAEGKREVNRTSQAHRQTVQRVSGGMAQPTKKRKTKK